MHDQPTKNQDAGKSIDSSEQPQTPETADSPAANPSTVDQVTELEKEMSGFEKSTLRWAKSAVIMSAFAALFVCAQWYEMHSGSGDTKTIAQASKDNASAAKSFARSAGEINKAVAQAVDELDKQAQAAQRSADAIVSSNRAWIVPDFPQENKPKIEAVNLVWHNAGKTPAVGVFSWKEYSSGNWPGHMRSCVEVESETKRRKSDLRQYQSFVAENGKYEIGLDHVPAWIGQQPINIHGCIWYTDVSSNTEKSSEFFHVTFQGKNSYPVAEGVLVFFDRQFIYK